jgi:hypothetical protein
MKLNFTRVSAVPPRIAPPVPGSDKHRVSILVTVIEREGRKPATTKEILGSDSREVKKIIEQRFSPANAERLMMGESVKIDNKTFKLNKEDAMPEPVRVINKNDGTITTGFGEKPKGRGIEEVRGN